jgi:hypothetical protein
MLKGTHAALPPSSAVFLRWRSLGRYCAISLGERMIIEVPSDGSDQLPDNEQKKLRVLPYKSKATFHWPSDCLWPFIDHEPETDT